MIFGFDVMKIEVKVFFCPYRKLLSHESQNEKPLDNVTFNCLILEWAEENQFEFMYKNKFRLEVFLNYCMFLIYLPVSHADTAPTLLLFPTTETNNPVIFRPE